MKNLKINGLIFILIVTIRIDAQVGLINNGAYLKINYNASVYIDGVSNGNLTNRNGGTVILDGNLTIKGYLDNQSIMILESDASLIDNGNSTGTGNSIVKKTVADTSSYLISSSVELTSASIFSDDIIYSFNESDSLWEELSSEDSLSVFNGYKLYVTKDTTLSIYGTLNTGNINTLLSADDEGWNLLGNPYPSTINWDTNGWDKSNIDNTLYLWKNNNFSYYISESGLSVNNGSKYIPPMCGFFVKANNQGNISISNSTRFHLPANNIYGESSSCLGDYIKMSITNNNYKDETLINIFVNASSDFDANFDAYKLLSEHLDVPQIYSIYSDNDKALSINSLSYKVNISIPIGIQVKRTDNYTIKIEDYNIENYDSVFLEDKFYNQSTKIYTNGKLSDTVVCSFDYDSEDDPNRFVLHFRNIKTDVKNIDSKEVNNIYAYSGKIYVLIGINGKIQGEIYIYNVAGILIKSMKIDQNRYYEIDMHDKPSGTYIVKLILNDKVLNKKVNLY